MSSLGCSHLRSILARPSIGIVIIIIIIFVSDDVEVISLELAARGATLGLDDLVVAVVPSSTATWSVTVIALFFAPLKVVLVDDSLVCGRFLDELLCLSLEGQTAPVNGYKVVVDLPRDEILVCEQPSIVFVQNRCSPL